MEKLTRKTPVLECLFNKVTRFRLQQRCFPVHFAKYFGKPFLQNISGGQKNFHEHVEKYLETCWNCFRSPKLDEARFLSPETEC